jgi:hypothetical protein
MGVHWRPLGGDEMFHTMFGGRSGEIGRRDVGKLCEQLVVFIGGG